MSLKDSVLEMLRESRGEYLSGEELSARLGVSRTAVWKAIRSLRGEGYRIGAVTNRGYLMQEADAGISGEEIRRNLPARYRGNRILVYDVTDSTNLRARQLAAEVSPEEAKSLHGAAVVALQQTAGRGRLGRSFFSPEEGIYLSIIVRPDFDLSKSVLVTVAAAAAVADAIEKVCGKDARIKWVNDVYLDGKKVCGILTEGISDFESGRIDQIVIGIGINTTLRGFPEELLGIAGAVEGDYSRSALAAAVIAGVLDYLEDLDSRKFMKTYREKSLLTGQTVTVYKGVYRKDPTEELGGRPARVLGIDGDGGLEVLYSDGTRETLRTGEVSIRTEKTEPAAEPADNREQEDPAR